VITLPTPLTTPLRGGPVLRWGILAPGSIADQWVTTVHANTDQRVQAVASRSQERAEAFAAKHGIERAYETYEQLVEDPNVDIVYIAAPHSAHKRLALLAIEAGKHVLVEKPMGVSAGEAREIADAARTSGVFAMEAMWSRFLPQWTVVDQLIADGALGDVLTVSADFSVNFTFDAESRIFNPALGGGALLDLGVYPAWLTHFILGVPNTVTTRGSLASTGVDAQSTTVLDFTPSTEGHGRQAVFTTGLFAGGTAGASIMGTRAGIQFPRTFLAPSSFLVGSQEDLTSWDDTSGLIWGEGLCYQATAVVQNIADGLRESPLHSLQDTIDILTVLDSARAQLGAR